MNCGGNQGETYQNYGFCVSKFSTKNTFERIVDIQKQIVSFDVTAMFAVAKLIFSKQIVLPSNLDFLLIN